MFIIVNVPVDHFLQELIKSNVQRKIVMDKELKIRLQRKTLSSLWTVCVCEGGGWGRVGGSVKEGGSNPRVRGVQTRC